MKWLYLLAILSTVSSLNGCMHLEVIESTNVILLLIGTVRMTALVGT